MRKPNYQQARKQKELSRKARQQEKQQRRGDRTEGEVPAASTEPGTLEGSPVAAEHAADDPVGSGV
jgi:hypothetical protein